MDDGERNMEIGDWKECRMKNVKCRMQNSPAGRAG